MTTLCFGGWKKKVCFKQLQLNVARVPVHSLSIPTAVQMDEVGLVGDSSSSDELGKRRRKKNVCSGRASEHQWSNLTRRTTFSVLLFWETPPSLSLSLPPFQFVSLLLLLSDCCCCCWLLLELAGSFPPSDDSRLGNPSHVTVLHRRTCTPLAWLLGSAVHNLLDRNVKHPPRPFHSRKLRSAAAGPLPDVSHQHTTRRRLTCCANKHRIVILTIGERDSGRTAHTHTKSGDRGTLSATH